MFNVSRKTKAIAAFLIVIAAGYLVARYWQGRNQIPEAFADARAQGASIAQNIVDISNRSTADLEKVNQYDAQGNYPAALDLTTQLITQSQDLRNQAVDLSQKVGDMTKALSSINSFDAQQAALESIASRLALINQLVSYSNDLQNLLTVLQGRFSGQSYVPGQVQGLVNQINTEVNAINNFNLQATQAMDKFDSIVNK